jgi:hypothetical protein
MIEDLTNAELLDQAAAAIKRGDVARGEQVLHSVLNSEPRNVLALLWMTRCTDDPYRKAALFQRALQIEPQDPHAIKGVELYRRYIGHADDLPSMAPQSEGLGQAVRHLKPTRRRPGRTIGLVGAASLLALALIAVVGGMLLEPLSNGRLSTFFESVNPAPTASPVPTDTPEQAYSRQIQPALAQLAGWVAGPLAEYQAVLTLYVDSEGNFTSNTDYITVGFWLSDVYARGSFYESMMIGRSDWDRFDRIMIENVAPRAEMASNEGFEVLSSFEAAIPPASVRKVHEQITECVQYTVELTAEVRESIVGGGYSSPKALEEKDPCNLLEPSVNSLEDFLEANHPPNNAVQVLEG